MNSRCQGLAQVVVFQAERTLLGNMQRCHTIPLSQGGEVKDMLDKGVNVAVCQKPHLADVDQLRGPFPDDLYAKQALALCISYQLEETVRNPGGLATRQFVKPRSPDQHTPIALPGFRLVQPDAGHLWNGVNPHRDKLWRMPHI
jgi:hypothetical protein